MDLFHKVFFPLLKTHYSYLHICIYIHEAQGRCDIFILLNGHKNDEYAKHKWPKWPKQEWLGTFSKFHDEMGGQTNYWSYHFKKAKNSVTQVSVT